MCTMVVTQLPTAPLLLLREETGRGVELRAAGLAVSRGRGRPPGRQGGPPAQEAPPSRVWCECRALPDTRSVKLQPVSLLGTVR